MTLLWAVRLLFAQATALAALTAYLIYLDLTAAPDALGVAISLTVFAALGAGAVYLVARALARRAGRARGPAVVIQLFILATGGFLLNVGPVWLGVLLMAVSALVGLLCVLPPTNKALGLD
ncbi:hypothetical protein GCM10010435_15490 [Winogradskya consettensis]|uniref:Uncharacterized protein n=1 Tax=Winogradskya consettensis TaxID=113560 RepID=A0A919VTW0_9ACTN|nr:hypothetical protein [Actinoplanes consettensis]GIM69334.1 hypothetical protein Aco04nite_14770 [Actinoplanes consettensis]